MVDKIVKFILGILIGCAILTGVYFILPRQYKSPINAKYQEWFEPNYKPIVEYMKQAKIPKHKGVTYDAAMSQTKNATWTIKKVSVDEVGNGAYEAYMDGYKCTVSVENDTNDDSMVTHTNAHVQLIFRFTKNGSEFKFGEKAVEAGKSVYPEQINVDEYSYYQSDTSTKYYKKTLDYIAGLAPQ